MPVNPIPAGYHSLQPYLIVDPAAAAIEFYKLAFGAVERLRMLRDDLVDDGRIAHAEIQIGDSILMLADPHPAVEAFAPAHYGGSPVSLLLYVPDCDALFRQALAVGATSVREPADQPYGDRMAGVQDPFGYRWWIATHIFDPGPPPA